jgi:hypothetical protein
MVASCALVLVVIALALLGNPHVDEALARLADVYLKLGIAVGTFEI